MLGVLYSASLVHFREAIMAALAFCLAASAVYVYNDIHDLEQDSLHPYKCSRPLASGALSIPMAITILLFLLVAGLGLGWYISYQLFFILCFYFVLNVCYNHFFKTIFLLDVLCIASGFMLRVLAGTLGIGIHLSGWLMMAAVLLSLLIVSSKRRLEKQFYSKLETRHVLKIYTVSFLDKFIDLSALASFVAYFLYVVIARQASIYFLVTLPFVAIGIARFVFLIRQESRQDDPMVILCRDYTSIINLLCFFILTTVALSVHRP